MERLTSTRCLAACLAAACLAWTASAQDPILEGAGGIGAGEPAPKSPEALAPNVSPARLGALEAATPRPWSTDVWSLGARVAPRMPFAGAPPSGEWLELGPLPAGAGRLGGVAREDLDAAGSVAPVAFDALPGGIVLGLVARPDVALAAPRIEMGQGRILVADGERRHALPRADARFLAACLAFASSGRADDAACDILGDGTVVLAPEFVDTAAGVTLVNGDRLPHARLGGRGSTKSLLLDRDARLRLDAATGELLPTAELEVRFCKPGQLSSNGAAIWVEATPVEGVLRVDLAETARIAAWVAFFRWAHAVDPDGTREIADDLAWSELELGVTRTPRRVEPRTAGPGADFGPSRTPSPVSDWMRAYRSNVEENADASAGSSDSR